MTLNKPNTQSGDFMLEVALNNVANYHPLNKFGHAPDCDTGVITDIWDGADGLTSTDIWAAPTTARIHALVSSDDDDKAGDTGMRTVMLHGLQSWTDQEETRETVILNGTTPVNSVNAYVIIYRMMGMTFGSSATNEGIIKATAATDNTITAVIQIGNGQTLMAIFGVPSAHRLVILHMHMDMLGKATASGTGRLVVETQVDQADSGERLNREWNLEPNARYDATLRPGIAIDGPAIVKLQVVTDAANSAVTGSIDGIIADTQHAPHSES